MLQPHRVGYKVCFLQTPTKASLRAGYWKVPENMRRCENMYAIIETGGKQLKVEVGQAIYIEKLDAATGDVVTFDKVLFVGGDSVKVGEPVIAGATVTAKVEKQGKQKKIIVFKYKAKKNYRKKQGHRQPYTKVTIEAINA